MIEFSHLLKSLLFFSLLGLSNSSYTQVEYDKFRALEQRVKYFSPDSLFFYANTIDTLNPEGKVFYYWSKGKAHFWQSNYPESYKLLEKASTLAEELGNEELLAEVYLDIAEPLLTVEQNGKALSYLLEANNILKKKGHQEQQERAKISLGEMYRKINSYDVAYTILHNTLSMVEKESYNHARCLNRLAAVHSESGRLDSSLYYSYQSLELAKQLEEPNLIATSENEIGYVLRVNRDLRASIPHFNRADSLWRSVGMLRYSIHAKHHISVVYGTIGELDKSLHVTHEAYNLLKGKQWYQLEANLLEDLRNLHYQLNQPDSARFYEHARLQAIIDKKDRAYAVNTRMVEVLFSQKQNEQTIREQEILLKNEALENEAFLREQSFLWRTLFLIGLILLIIFIYAYRQRKLKLKLFLENKEKESKNAQLEDALRANEALVQEISHRVKNNLAVLSGLLTMQAQRSDNKKVIDELNSSVLRIESIATIHKSLYDKRTDAKIDLKYTLEELSRNILAAMGIDPKECLELKLENCEVDIATAVTLSLIINEGITNSCKYAIINNMKKLTIELQDFEKKIVCKIIDRGTGFDIEKTDTNKNTLGLYLMKLLAKQLKAVPSWRRENKSFIFTIELTKNELS